MDGPGAQADALGGGRHAEGEGDARSGPFDACTCRYRGLAGGGQLGPTRGQRLSAAAAIGHLTRREHAAEGPRRIRQPLSGRA